MVDLAHQIHADHELNGLHGDGEGDGDEAGDEVRARQRQDEDGGGQLKQTSRGVSVPVLFLKLHGDIFWRVG